MSLKFTQTSYKVGLSYKLTITSTASVRTPVMADQYTSVSLATTVDTWFNIGSSTVTAAASTGPGVASRFVPAGTILFVNKDAGKKYIAAIADSAAGKAVVGEEGQ